MNASAGLRLILPILVLLFMFFTFPLFVKAEEPQGEKVVGIEEIYEDAKVTASSLDYLNEDGTRTLTLFSGTRFAQNSTGHWVNPSDVLRITRDQDDITFHYNGIKGDHNVTFETGVIYNENYYSMAEVKQLQPQIEFDFPSEKKETYRKYAVNITNIPEAMWPNIECYTLKDKSHSGFTLDQLKQGDRWFHIKDTMALYFKDLLEKHDVSLNKAEKRIYIHNMTENIVDGSLYLDPTLQLQDNITENLDDTYVDESYADTEYSTSTNLFVGTVTGSQHKSFLKFNISAIPSGYVIDDSCLYLYIHTNEYEAEDSPNIDVVELDNQTWREGETKWNSQPFGVGNIIDSDNTIGTSFNVWQGFDVTLWVNSSYSSGYPNVSFQVNGTETGETDRIGYFSSNYNVDASLRPYLNITYSNTPPAYSSNSTNDTYTGRSIAHSLGWTDDVGLSGYIFGFNNNTPGTDIQDFTKPDTDFDFTGKTYHYANEYHSAGNPGKTDGTGINSSDYDAIQSSDDSYWTITGDRYYNMSQIFVFDTDYNDTEISLLNATIELKTSIVGCSNSRFYVWNNTLDGWSYLANVSTTEQNVSWETSDQNVIADIVDSSGDVVLRANTYRFGALSCTIFTDWIQLKMNACPYTLDSWAPLTGTSDWTNVTKDVNSTVGTIRWKVWANDTANAWNTSLGYSYATVASNLAPYIDNTTEPSETTYVYNQTYGFNTTICDPDGTSDLDTVNFEWDSANTTVSDYDTLNSTCRTYSINKTGLSASTFSWNWYANDTSNEEANESGTFTVSKATPSLTTSATSPITFGNASDYSGSESNQGDGGCVYTLDRNGSQIATGSSVSDNSILAAGTHEYNYSTDGCENFTAASSNNTLTINKQSVLYGSLTINPAGWEHSYPAEVHINFTESNLYDEDCVYRIWRDGVNVFYGENWTPTAGSYDHELNLSADCQNYSSLTLDNEILTVNKVPPSAGSVAYSTDNSTWQSTDFYITSSDTIYLNASCTDAEGYADIVSCSFNGTQEGNSINQEAQCLHGAGNSCDCMATVPNSYEGDWSFYVTCSDSNDTVEGTANGNAVRIDPTTGVTSQVANPDFSSSGSLNVTYRAVITVGSGIGDGAPTAWSGTYTPTALHANVDEWWVIEGNDADCLGTWIDSGSGNNPSWTADTADTTSSSFETLCFNYSSGVTLAAITWSADGTGTESRQDVATALTFTEDSGETSLLVDWDITGTVTGEDSCDVNCTGSSVDVNEGLSRGAEAYGDWVGTVSKTYTQNTSDIREDRRITFNGTASWVMSANAPATLSYTYDLGMADVGGTCSGDTWLAGNTGTVTGATASATMTELYRLYADCVDRSAAGWAYASSFSQNLTKQKIESNITYANNWTGSLSINDSTTVSDSDWGSCDACAIAALTVLTAGATYIFNDTADVLTETWGSYTQDTTRTTGSGVMSYVRRALNVTNIGGVTISNVDTKAANRTSWTCADMGRVSVNTSAQYNRTHYQTCNATTITETDDGYVAMVDSVVTVGQNATVQQNFTVSNTDALVSYQTIINLTDLFRTNFTNTTPAYFNQSIGSGIASSIAVNMSGVLVEEDASSGRCPEGWSVYTQYCYYTNLTDSPRLRYYFVRTFLKINDSIINTTNISYSQPISRFTDWATRNSGETVNLTNVTAGISHGNASVSSNATHVTVNITPGSPTLEQGTYRVQIEWNVDRPEPPGESPPGGGGGGSTPGLQTVCGNGICEYGENEYNCPKDCLMNVTFRTSPEEHWRDYISPGESKNHTLTIMNPNAFSISARVEIDQSDEDESWMWSTLVKGEERATWLNVNVSAGSEDVPGRKEVVIETRAPTVLKRTQYWANVIVNVGASRKAIPLRYEKSITTGWLSWLDEDVITFDANLEKRMGMPGLPWKFVILGLIVLGIIGIYGAWYIHGAIVKRRERYY